MAAVNLGVNSASIGFEVALDVLGQSRQPFMAALRDERTKAKPSQIFIRYCEARLLALDELQDDLDPSDQDTIERILGIDGDSSLFSTVPSGKASSPRQRKRRA
jgi:hypothetical protein